MIELTRHKNLGIHQNVNSDVDISVDNIVDKSDLTNSGKDNVDKEHLVETKEGTSLSIKTTKMEQITVKAECFKVKLTHFRSTNFKNKR